MNNNYSLLLDNGGNSNFGYYQPMALVPQSHLKGNNIWLPYDFIMDMSKVLILAERRNFRNEYANLIHDKFQLVIDKESVKTLPLSEIWSRYKGQIVSKEYRENKCFPIFTGYTNQKIRKIKGPSKEQLLEWQFSIDSLLSFFSDPRYQGFLLKSGFTHEIDQLQFELMA